MTKKISFLIGICITLCFGGWISFDGTPNPVSPTISVLQSDNECVILNVKIHGMNIRDTAIGGKHIALWSSLTNIQL